MWCRTASSVHPAWPVRRSPPRTTQHNESRVVTRADEKGPIGPFLFFRVAGRRASCTEYDTLQRLKDCDVKLATVWPTSTGSSTRAQRPQQIAQRRDGDGSREPESLRLVAAERFQLRGLFSRLHTFSRHP